jgi:membrane fusion protein, multidrug efflux system
MSRFIIGERSDFWRLFCRFFSVTSFFLCAALMLTNGCSKKEPGKPNPVAPVKTAVSIQKDIPVEIPANGTVEAYSVVNITSRVEGTIIKVHIQEGQNIEKGQLLFSIDDRAYQAVLQSAQSNLLRDRIRQEKAAKDAVRYADLIKKDYVTKTLYEQALTDAQALEATVKGDEAQLENAGLNVAYCRITAPVSGRAGAVLINEGNTVKANDSRPLMVIHQVQPVFVKFSVPEQLLSDIQNKMSIQELAVIAELPGDKKETKKGRLTFLDNTINPSTGTIDLKATFENCDNRLWPGEFVNVLLLLGIKPGAVVVPSQSVQIGQQGNFVFVVKNDLTVAYRAVTPGIQINGQTLIEKGLKSGETVVTDGHLRLFEGAKVIVKNEPNSGGESR